MRRGWTTVLYQLALALVVAGGAAADIDYGDPRRYDVIVSKKPFGVAPQAKPAPEAAAPAPGSAQDPMKAVRVVGLTYKEPFGLRIGLVDSGVNPAKNYLLSVGESTDEGILVVDADIELEAVLLSAKMPDGKALERWFYLSGSGGGAGGGPVPSVAVPGPQGGAPLPANASESYLERLKKRREAIRARSQEQQQPKLQGEALEKHLQEYNMELIRKAAKGESAGPPLPIQLTPEQDKQLVEEGVLPPQ